MGTTVTGGFRPPDPNDNDPGGEGDSGPHLPDSPDRSTSTAPDRLLTGSTEQVAALGQLARGQDSGEATDEASEDSRGLRQGAPGTPVAPLDIAASDVKLPARPALVPPSSGGVAASSDFQRSGAEQTSPDLNGEPPHGGAAPLRTDSQGPVTGPPVPPDELTPQSAAEESADLDDAAGVALPGEPQTADANARPPAVPTMAGPTTVDPVLVAEPPQAPAPPLPSPVVAPPVVVPPVVAPAPAPTPTAPEPTPGAPPPPVSIPAAKQDVPRKKSKLRWISRFAVLAIVAALVAIGAFFGTWWKAKQDADGVVSPGVALNGRSIAGLTEEEVTERAAKLNGLLAERKLAVVGPENTVQVSYADLGLSVDAEAIAGEAMTERPVDNPRTWWQTRSDPVQLAIPLTIDPVKAADVIDQIQVADKVEPVQPTLTFDGTDPHTTPGSDGFGIKPSDLFSQLPTKLDDGEVAITVTPTALKPSLTEDELIAQADKVIRSRGKGINVTVDGQTEFIDVDTLIDWVHSEQTPAGVVLAIDPAEMAQDLSSTFTKVGTYGSATFAPDETTGELVVTSTESGVRCCGEIDAQVVFDHLAKGDRTPIELPTVAWDPVSGQDELRARGMTRVVGEFTTNHPGGASRVVNIHRIADIVNGAIIEPGDTFSVNDYVGRRTTEKGFVDAGVILEGRYESDVGGGVSQFATTLFNAAFFGGLDIPEYQSHSLYISRYPYGREATLWYPVVDLKIHNQTETPVLITTNYTDTSITVRLFSTPSMVSDQTGQTKSRARCTTVRTERTRTPINGGEPIVDYFTSTYRPAEGVSC